MRAAVALLGAALLAVALAGGGAAPLAGAGIAQAKAGERGKARTTATGQRRGAKATGRRGARKAAKRRRSARLRGRVVAQRARPGARWRRTAFAGGSPSTGAPAGSPGPAAPLSPADEPPPPPPPPPPLPEADPRSVSVGSTEWALTLSQPSVLAGTVRVQFDNSRAEDPHDLVVIAPGGSDVWSFGEIGPGAVVTKELPLKAPGTYRLVCPLPQHEARGMAADLVVNAS